MGLCCCCGNKNKNKPLHNEMIDINRNSIIGTSQLDMGTHVKIFERRSLIQNNESVINEMNKNNENECQKKLEEKFGINKIEIKTTTKREKIIEEILITEQNYVQTLSIFSELVLTPCLDDYASRSQKTNFSELRNKLDAVLRVNNTLLSLLEQKATKGNLFNSVGDVFKLLTPFLKLYSDFAVTYEQTLPFFSTLQVNQSFVKFYTLQREKYPLYIKNDFTSYAITPIQRIPRYEMLLKELLKETSPEHTDYPFLTKSLEEIKIVANFVNQAITKSKNMLKLLDIVNLFITKIELIASHRVFIKQGLLTKVCRRSDEKRMFFLFNDKLIYGKPVIPIGIDVLGITKYILSFDFLLSNIKLNEMPLDPISFEIIGTKKSFVVKTLNSKEKQEWIMEINNALKEENKRRLSFQDGNKSNSPKNRNFAPVFQTNVNNCNICQEKFTPFKKPHHCKNCGKCICDSCSKAKSVIPTLDTSNKQRVCDLCVRDNLL
eukprot:TRINITY_DN17093_c0_g1_i1.p1 TRINITY_DN17093_c0_g1~~TRINITY_DN17093_c0_g1_i1.p1  ORF type:complete len:491 (-),score=108.24 TRINITY_DN17093_c0_g1_i1:16-1488(-)